MQQMRGDLVSPVTRILHNISRFYILALCIFAACNILKTCTILQYIYRI